MIICSTSHFWFAVRVDGGGGGGEGEKRLHSPTPLPSYHPLGINFYSPQPSAAIKIKDGGHNIHDEITQHLLAKIMPALQATATFDLFLPHNWHQIKRFFHCKSMIITHWHKQCSQQIGQSDCNISANWVKYDYFQSILVIISFLSVAA